MENAVLLRQFDVEGQFEFDNAVLDARQLGADRAQCRLAFEILADSLAEIAAVGIGHAHAPLATAKVACWEKFDKHGIGEISSGRRLSHSGVSQRQPTPREKVIASIRLPYILHFNLPSRTLLA
jgi:hypothetical protein